MTNGLAEDVLLVTMGLAENILLLCPSLHVGACGFSSTSMLLDRSEVEH
jgi:hypothetical protein